MSRHRPYLFLAILQTSDRRFWRESYAEVSDKKYEMGIDVGPLFHTNVTYNWPANRACRTPKFAE
jgi:hypothetical protein